MAGVLLRVRCRGVRNNRAPSAGERVGVVDQLLGAVGRKKEGRRKEANGMRRDERCVKRNKQMFNL